MLINIMLDSLVSNFWILILMCTDIISSIYVYNILDLVAVCYFLSSSHSLTSHGRGLTLTLGLGLIVLNFKNIRVGL